jgi:hypothetical protein
MHRAASVSAVAIAEPIAPTNGISIIFSGIFTTRLTIVAQMYRDCFPQEMKIVPAGPFIQANGATTIKIESATPACEYSGPYTPASKEREKIAMSTASGNE